MPILTWLGKDKVINHHQNVPYRILEPQYTHGDSDTGNMLIHGDNLDALKALLPRYEGRIKCIYIEIITPSLIQFDVSFLPEIQKGARFIKRVHLHPTEFRNVKRFGNTTTIAA
ncbi:hypothetical protein FACS1894217_12320 [Clostridia bacterium]|nr:hypothetical protein FACS1894217_12320 [Clostridia bacterium]